MKYYKITAELLSPLMVQKNRQSSSPQTLQYLPGSTLRGAVAGQYLRTGGNAEDEDFKTLFLRDAPAFPDLLPADDPDAMPRPLPMTAQSCKIDDGFKSEGAHGVMDMLAASCAIKRQPENQKEIFKCRRCGQKMEPFTGFWNGDTGKPEKFKPVFTYQRHTGIDRTTETVAQSIFYTTHTLADGKRNENGNFTQQYMSGGTFLTDAQFSALEKIINHSSIFTGADRTRGLGELKVCAKEADPLSPTRFDLEGWDRCFREKMSAMAPEDESTCSDGLYFSVGLRSRAIFVDKFLRPSFDLKLDIPDVEPIQDAVRKQHTTVKGWQSSWGLPKPEDKALETGSVFLFRYAGDDVSELSTCLEKIAARGVGLRTAEGLGQVTVCDPIHTTKEAF